MNCKYCKMCFLLFWMCNLVCDHFKVAAEAATTCLWASAQQARWAAGHGNSSTVVDAAAVRQCMLLLTYSLLQWDFESWWTSWSCVLLHPRSTTVILAGLPQHDLDRIQSMLNAATRLTADVRKFDRVTPLPVNLQWLLVPECIQYKLCVLMHCCLSGAALQYLSELIHPLSDVDSHRRLRSV